MSNAHLIYLHGFASSAKSTKAAYFAEQLGRLGLSLDCPDFNEPDFSTLTMTRMLEEVERRIEACAPRPIGLIGSSLGGTLAILAADRFPRIERVVLLAPAVMFAQEGHHLLPPDRVAQWRRAGALPFF